jgi:hypothetical protein
MGSSNYQIDFLKIKMQPSEEFSMSSSRRHNNTNSRKRKSRESRNMVSKHLSSNKIQPKYKRSNTKDEKRLVEGHKLSISTIDDNLKKKKKQQMQVSVN